MFGLSFPELLIIAVLALVLLGADRLPEAARSLGKGLRELRRAGQEVKDQLEREVQADELKGQIEAGLRAEEPKPVPSVVPAMPVPSGGELAPDQAAAAGSGAREAAPAGSTVLGERSDGSATTGI